MKINEPGRISAVNSYQKQQDKRMGENGKARKTDAVHISNEAKLLLSQVSDPGRSNRIDGLKQSVSSGSYYVDAGKIAEKLLPYLK